MEFFPIWVRIEDMISSYKFIFSKYFFLFADLKAIQTQNEIFVFLTALEKKQIYNYKT